ncbi:tetratricopeptide repeat protein [Nocardia xishanensis]
MVVNISANTPPRPTSTACARPVEERSRFSACCTAATGRTGSAFDHHRRAAEPYAALGDHHDRAAAINGVGETARAAGDLHRALADHAAALRLAEDHGNRSEQARAEEGFARIHHDLGDTDSARHHARRALAGWRALQVPDAEDVRAFLDGLGEPTLGYRERSRLASTASADRSPDAAASASDGMSSW